MTCYLKFMNDNKTNMIFNFFQQFLFFLKYMYVAGQINLYIDWRFSKSVFIVKKHGKHIQTNKNILFEKRKCQINFNEEIKSVKWENCVLGKQCTLTNKQLPFFKKKLLCTCVLHQTEETLFFGFKVCRNMVQLRDIEFHMASQTPKFQLSIRHYPTKSI